MKTMSLLVSMLWVVTARTGEPVAVYNFQNRVLAPCPYPKELVEKRPAAPYVPDEEEGELGPPLLHQYGEKYGSRSHYDPREKGGVLHMKFSHPFYFDTFHTEAGLLADDAAFLVELTASVQYGYGRESTLCSISGMRLSIRDYSPLTGSYTVALDDGSVRISGDRLAADSYHRFSFGRSDSGASFLRVNGVAWEAREAVAGEKAAAELRVGGANDVKISEIRISVE